MSDDWWLYYTHRDEMVAVGIEPDCLQNKMKFGNMKICEKCLERDKEKRLVVGGYVMNCPLGEIDLIEDTRLPSDCPYRLEHVVIFHSQDS